MSLRGNLSSVDGPSKTLSSVPSNKIMGEKGRRVRCGQHVCPTKCILDDGNGFIEMHHAKYLDINKTI